MKHFPVVFRKETFGWSRLVGCQQSFLVSTAQTLLTPAIPLVSLASRNEYFRNLLDFSKKYIVSGYVINSMSKLNVL